MFFLCVCFYSEVSNFPCMWLFWFTQQSPEKGCKLLNATWEQHRADRDYLPWWLVETIYRVQRKWKLELERRFNHKRSPSIFRTKSRGENLWLMDEELLQVRHTCWDGRKVHELQSEFESAFYGCVNATSTHCNKTVQQAAVALWKVTAALQTVLVLPNL